jgi:hypothetical protein
MINELNVIEIDDLTFFETTDGSKIGSISQDDDLTQPWVIRVNGEEFQRANTKAKAEGILRRHFLGNTLQKRYIPKSQRKVA